LRLLLPAPSEQTQHAHAEAGAEKAQLRVGWQSDAVLLARRLEATGLAASNLSEGVATGIARPESAYGLAAELFFVRISRYRGSP
jgi:hypothetical protein